MFLVLGAFVGALVTLILTSQFPADPAVGFAATAGYFLLFGVPAGVALGAVGRADHRPCLASRARSTVTAEREVVGEVAGVAVDAIAIEVARGSDPHRRCSASTASTSTTRSSGSSATTPCSSSRAASSCRGTYLAPAYPGSKDYNAVPGELLEDAEWLQDAIRAHRRRAARAASRRSRSR